MALNTPSICNASSRDGTSTTACTSSVVADSRCTSGRRNASVLPEPVGERTIRLLHSPYALPTASCIRFNCSIFRFSSISVVFIIQNKSWFRQTYGKSLEYPPNCSRLTQQDLIIRELEEKRRSWADS